MNIADEILEMESDNERDTWYTKLTDEKKEQVDLIKSYYKDGKFDEICVSELHRRFKAKTGISIARTTFSDWIKDRT